MTMTDKNFRKHAKPAEGLTVYDPNGNRKLPPEGKNVSGNESYWRRREQEKSVVLSTVKATLVRDETPPPRNAKEREAARAREAKEAEVELSRLKENDLKKAEEAAKKDSEKKAEEAVKTSTTAPVVNRAHRSDERK